MREISKEEIGWLIGKSWLYALEESARDFFSAKPKTFTERAYEHSTWRFLEFLRDEYNMKIEKCNSIKEAVEKYIEVGVQTGLFSDVSDFQLEEITPFRVNIKVFNCPYKDVCTDLFQESGFIDRRNMPCTRIGCFRAAVLHLADIDTQYEVTEINPAGMCEGFIER